VDAHAPEQTFLQLVGGTFTLKGVTSPVQHSILCRVLRIAIYAHLSLVLEQHVLANSGVELRFTKRKTSPTIPHAPLPAPAPEQRQGTRHKHYSHLPGLLGSGILSYFSKKTGNLLHRSGTMVSNVRHGSSLDLTSPLGSRGVGNTPVSLDEGKFVGRRRRFSLLGERVAVTRPLEIETPKSPFSSALLRLDQSKNMLSTSVGVVFSPPTLIVRLAEKEKLNAARKLKGDERAGLSSLLGWEDKDSGGAGMTGTSGFVQQQQISTLYSQHVPAATPPQTQPNAGSASASLSASSNSVKSVFQPCDRARWITFRYYSRHCGSDRLLGEAVSELCSGSQAPCDTPGCLFKRGQHQLRFIHGGIRVSLDMQDDHDDDREEAGEKQGKNGRVDAEKISVWESCLVCHERTQRKVMNDGTLCVQTDHLSAHS
jgi:1-phosphatidylinositol-3-phosphate 5-kinase